MSQVFAKRGGLECLLGFVENDNLPDEVRAAAANTIGTMGQNNPVVQNLAKDRDITGKLIDVLYSGKASDDLAAKVSCLDAYTYAILKV
jgi:hypothetical protein